MSKGFVVLAQNNSTVDYVQQAYALALSICATQTAVTAVTLVTNNRVPKQYRSAFDSVVKIPWTDSARGVEWKVQNRWKLYHASPYEHTMVLDADMLMTADISEWWQYCSHWDMKFCSRVVNYKQELVHDQTYRKTFLANNLCNVYHALHYFKKSPAAQQFYHVLEFVVNNWQACYSIMAGKQYQNWLSMDLACAIAIEICGAQDMIDVNSPLQFTHMKPAIQGWSQIPQNWQDVVQCRISSTGTVTVGNIQQGKLLHYVEKNFVTSQLLCKLEALAHAA